MNLINKVAKHFKLLAQSTQLATDRSNIWTQSPNPELRYTFVLFAKYPFSLLSSPFWAHGGITLPGLWCWVGPGD